MIRTGESALVGSSEPPASTPEDDAAVAVQSAKHLESHVYHRNFDQRRANRLVTSAEEVIVGRHWSERR